MRICDTLSLIESASKMRCSDSSCKERRLSRELIKPYQLMPMTTAIDAK